MHGCSPIVAVENVPRIDEIPVAEIRGLQSVRTDSPWMPMDDCSCVSNNAPLPQPCLQGMEWLTPRMSWMKAGKADAKTVRNTNEGINSLFRYGPS